MYIEWLIVCVCAHIKVYHRVHAELVDNSQEDVLSFYHEGLGNWIQVGNTHMAALCS